MNLNFYPNDFNSSYNPMNNNMYNPYNVLLGLDGKAGLNQIQQNTENRLQQLQQLQNQYNITNNLQQNNTQTQNTQQPYYLFCGNKNDWDEFLILHYGITEQNIFDDYRLFLQAKQEILEEQGKNKKDTMKDKLRNNNDKSNVKSSVSPKSTRNSKQWKSTSINNINRRYNNPSVRDNSQRDNRPLEQPVKQQEEENKEG